MNISPHTSFRQRSPVAPDPPKKSPPLSPAMVRWFRAEAVGAWESLACTVSPRKSNLATEDHHFLIGVIYIFKFLFANCHVSFWGCMHGSWKPGHTEDQESPKLSFRFFPTYDTISRTLHEGSSYLTNA